MKKSCTQQLKLTLIGVFIILLSLLAGAVIGIQYFYQDFVDLKTQIKDTFGIVTAADAALLAEQEALTLASSETAEEQAEDGAVSTDAQEETVAQTDLRIITINGQETEIDLLAGTHTWFDTYQMTTEMENTFVFGDFSGYDIYFEGEAVSEGSEVSVTLEALSVAIGLELKVVSQETGETRYYYIRTLHSQYSAVSVGQGEGEGYYYFTSLDAMYKMDMSGNIVFYKATGSDYVRDFKQTIIDGTVYYSYLEDISPELLMSNTSMIAIVMDENYEVIDVVETLSTDAGMENYCYLDDHEFIILGEHHYLITSYAYQTVTNIPTEVAADNTANVCAAVMQEIKDGELLFQWCSTDYPELYAYSIRESRLADDSVTTYIDYMHFNSIAIDPEDGNYVLSFRSLSALIKVDSETAEIIWILGGEGDDFSLTDEQMMSYQHFPQYWDSDTITVFDNGTDNEQTRILEYVLDEETMTVVDFNAYEIDGWYSAAMGSAIRLGDTEPIYLVSWGQVEANNIMFSEINFETGEVLFQLMDVDCTSNFWICTYRVYKFDS